MTELFFIDFDDFCKHFNVIYVARQLEDEVGEVWNYFDFEGEWKGSSAAGSSDNPRWFMNPQYVIKPLEESTRIFFSLRYEDFRMKYKKKVEYPHAGIMVIQKSYDDDCREMGGERLGSSTYFNCRENSLEFFAEVGKTYIVLPSTAFPGIEMKYYFDIYTQQPSDVHQVTQLRNLANTKGEWTSQTSGGRKQCQTWNQNPKYLLTVPDDCFMTISLIQPGEEKEWAHIGFYLLNNNSKTGSYETLAISQFIDLMIVSESYTVNSGQYVIVPCTYEPLDRLCSFAVSVYSTAKCSIQMM